MYNLDETSYVAEDGNFGTGYVLTFPYDSLTEEQWDTLDILPDSHKIAYAKAILDGEDLSAWED